MATRYVSNNPAGSSTSPYDTLAKAATTWATAITGSAAGDVFAFSNLHNETTAAATTETMPGTAASPNQGYSFDNTQTTLSATDLLVGATIQTSGSNNLTITGTGWTYGVTLIAGTGSGASNLIFGSTNSTQHWDTCSFQLNTTGAGNTITIGNGSGIHTYIEWNNCTIQVGATGQGIDGNSSAPCKLIWRNTPNAIVGSTFPTNVFKSTYSGTAFVEGVDFSALPNTSHLAAAFSNRGAQIYFKDCKIPSGMTVASSPTVYGAKVYFTRTDSTGSVNRFDVYDYSATETLEPSITRVGGQADFAGNLWSKKIVTTANAQVIFPYECEISCPLNSLTGAVRTVTVFGTINAGSVPNNNDIWVEGVYPQDSGDTLGGFVNSGATNPLAAGLAVASDSSTWNGGGSGAGWSPFKLVVTLTAQLKGPLTVRVKVAKASTTYYIDPTPVLS